MSSPLMSALLMTGIGMGLVFVVILMLWGMMVLTVRVTAHAAEKEEAESGAEREPTEAVGGVLDDRKHRAAAAAVAVALAMQRASISTAPASGPAVSSWQAVTRADRLNQRSALYYRKPRGNSR